MTTLSARIEDLRQAMNDADPSDYETLGSLQADLDELEEQREVLELEWLQAAEALGE